MTGRASHTRGIGKGPPMMRLMSTLQLLPVPTSCWGESGDARLGSRLLCLARRSSAPSVSRRWG
jgi:phage gp46-like protein